MSTDNTLIEKGNIDLTKRPVVKNSDGSISTVRSMSFNDNGKEILIPTVSDIGTILSDEAAITNYYKTGKHLGKFSTAEAATAYAENLHNEQDKMYSNKTQISQFNISDLSTTSMDAQVDKLRSELSQVAQQKANKIALQKEAEKQPITRNTFEDAFSNAASAENYDAFMNLTSPLSPETRSDIYAKVRRNQIDSITTKKTDTKLFTDSEINDSMAKYMTNMALGAVGRVGDIAGSLLNVGTEAVQLARLKLAGLDESAFETAKSISRKKDIYADARDALRTEKDPAKAQILRERMELNSPSNYSELEKASLIKEQITTTDETGSTFVTEGKSINEKVNAYFKGNLVQSAISEYAGSLSDVINNSGIETMIQSAKADYTKQVPKFESAIKNFESGHPLNAVGDIVSAVVGLTSEAGALIIDNPATVMQLMLQTAPDIITASRAMPAALAGNFIEKQQEAKETYRTTYNKEPIGESLLKLNGYAFAGALLDTYGDRLVGKGGVDLAKMATAIGLKSGAVKASIKATQGTITGAAGEFIAEGGGNLLTQQAGLQDASKIDVSRAYAEGVLGAAAGGGIATITSAFNSVGEATLPVAQKMQARTEAKKSGSIKDLVSDVRNMDITGATAVMKNITADPNTTPEQKAQAVADLETAFEHRPLIEVYVGQAEIAQADEGYNEFRAQGIARGKAVLAEMDRAAESVKIAKDSFRGQSVEQAYKTITSENVTPEASRQAAATISESVNEPYSTFSTEMARNILETRAEALTQSQVENLRSYVATNEAFDNLQGSLDSSRVRSNIIDGGNGNIGARTYVNAIISSIRLGDSDGANKLAKDLTNFAQRQSAKAAAASQIIASFEAGIPMPAAEQIRLMSPFDSKAKGSKFRPIVNAVPRYLRMIDEEAQMLSIVSNEMNNRVNTLAQTGNVRPEEANEVAAAPAAVDELATEGSNITNTASNVNELPRVNIGTDSNSWVNTNAQAARDTADRLNLTSKIEQLFADGLVAAQVTTRLNDNGDLNSIPVEERGSFVVQVRATLGIPSQMEEEGQTEFNSWLTERNRRNQPTAQQEEAVAPLTPPTEPADAESNRLLSATQAMAGEELTKGLINEDANPISQYFTISESAKIGNPLVANANFFNQLKQEGFTYENLKKYLPESVKSLSSEQIKLLQNLTRFNAAFSASFNEVFVPTDFKYAHNDFINYFADQSGVIKQSVIDTMSVSMFNWMITSANDSLIKDNRDVGTIMGIDSKNTEFSNYTWSTIGKAGLPFNEEAIRIGNEIINSLGLRASKNAPYTSMDRLAASLGGHAIYALSATSAGKEPLLKIVNVSREEREIAGLIEGNFNREPMSEADAKAEIKKPGYEWKYDAPLKTIQVGNTVNQYGTREPLQAIKNLAIEPSKGTKGILSAIFSSVSKVPAPSFSPISSKDSSPVMKRTDRRISEKAKTVHDKFNQTKTFLKPEMVRMFNMFDRNDLLDMFGFKTDIENTVHKDRVESEISKNNLIESSIAKVFEFLDIYDSETNSSDFSVPFYLDHETTRTNRAQLTQRIMNPQTDKIARHMVYRDNWKSELDITNDDHVNAFTLAVGQALDVSLDKNTNIVSMEATLEKLNDPVISAGIQSAINVLNFKESPDDLMNIKNAVIKAGTANHALDGIMAYAGFVNALNKGQNTFETTLAVERDGVTNGPILTLMQFGGSYNINTWIDDLQSGGVYINSTLENIGDAKQQGISDIYQKVAGRMYEKLRTATSVALNQSENSPVLRLTDSTKKTLGVLFGELNQNGESQTLQEFIKEKRNLSKSVVTPKTYQAGDTATKRKIASEAIKSIQKSLEEYAANANNPNISIEDAALAQSKLKALANALNEIAPNLIDVPVINGKRNYLNATIKTGSVYSYDSMNVKKPIKLTFEQFIAATYGALFTEAVNEQNISIAEPTAQAVTVTNMAVMVYGIARRAVIDTVSHYKKNIQGPVINPIERELTIEQAQQAEKRLSGMFPEVMTALSNKQGEGISLVSLTKDSGLPGFSAELKLSPEVPGAYSVNGVQSKPTKTATIRGNENNVEAPGVRGVVNNVLATDGAIMIEALGNTEGMLNLYDAHMSGVLTSLENTKELNRAFFDIAMNHSLPSKIAEAALRSINGFIDLMGPDYVFTSADIKKYSLQEFAGDQDITAADIQSYIQANKEYADRITASKRNRLINNRITVNHYYEEGAAVTYVNGQEVTSIPEEELTPAFVNAIDDIGQTIRTNEAEDLESLDQTLAVQETGEINPVQPTADNDLEISPELAQAFLDKNDVMSLSDALGLIEQLSNSDTINAVKAIASAIAGKTKSNLKIVRYSASKKYAGELSWLNNNQDIIQYAYNSRGMFFNAQATGGDPTIVLMSETMPFSGMNKETLFHEIVHHLFDERVYNSANSPIGDELQNLNRAVRSALPNLLANDPESKAFVDSFGGINRFPALSSMREFVAWGLSSNSFQRILSQISYTSTKELDQKLSIKPRTVMAKLRDLVQKVIFNRDVKSPTNIPVDNALKGLITVALKSQQGIIGRATPMEASRQHAPINNKFLVNKLTSMGVFNALANVGNQTINNTHREYLATIMGTVVNAVLTPLDVNVMASISHENLSNVTAKDKLDIFLKDNTGINVPGNIPTYGFHRSAQEAYVHGIYNIILDEGLKQSSVHLNAANDYFNKAKSSMTYKNFMDDPSSTNTIDIQQAQDRYDSVFNINVSQSEVITDQSSGLSYTKQKSDYLRNFLALAATNEKFRNELNNIPAPDTEVKADTLFQKIIDLVMSVIDWVSDRIVGIDPRASNTKNIDMLSKRLVGAELRAQSQAEKVFNNSLSYSAGTLNKGIVAIKAGLVKLGSLPVLKKSPYAAARIVGSLARIVGNNRTQFLFDTAADLFNRMNTGKQGFVSHVISEVKGTTQDNAKIHSLMRVANYTLDQSRKLIIDAMGKTLAKQFKGMLTDSQKAAITKAVLRTDMVSLIPQGYTLTNLADLLTDRNYLNQEINRLESSLRVAAPGKLSTYYINSADALGFTMVNGYSGNVNTVPNAYGIARLWGTGQIQPMDSTLTRVEPIIDALASLRAVQRVSPEVANSAAQTILREANRSDREHGPDNNGMIFVLKQHEDLKAKAMTENFSGKPGLMRKGFMPDITNPYIDIQVGTALDKDAMRDMGYKEAYPLEKDVHDPNQSKLTMYVGDGAGLTSYLRGALSTTGKGTKGTTVKNVADVAIMEANKFNEINKLFTSRISPELNKGNTYMQPLFNEDGAIVDYRYTVAEKTKDDILQRNDDFTQVLGSLAGNVYDKAQTKPHNEQVIDALKAQYDLDIAAGRDNLYIRVSGSSTDSELKDAYNLLPYETKKYVLQVFGSNSIPIRGEFVSVIFGYHKITVADLWKEGGVKNNLFQSAVKSMFETLFAEKGMQRASQFERVIQELVKIAKSNIVVRMGEVTLMNLISNTYDLMVNGLNMKEAITDQVTGYKKGIEYIRNKSRIAELDLLLQANQNPADASKMIDERTQLKHLQSINPVGELIEAGLLQSIVLDVTQDVDPFSYSSQLMNRLDGQLDKMPDAVKDTAKFIFMTKDSASYEFMNKMVQFSDFAARYAMYKKLTTRVNNPMDKSSAIQAVIDQFVNYDLPTHKALQYGNDMGVIWFSRYWLRIQKIIAKNFAEQPANVLLGLGIQQMIGVDIPDNTDSSILTTGPIHSVRSPFSIWDGIMSNPILPN